MKELTRPASPIVRRPPPDLAASSCQPDVANPSSPLDRPSAPDVSIVIVTYNCQDLIRPCLASIDAGSGSLRHEVVIVDNDSRDGTRDWLPLLAGRIRVIQNDENRGFAAACNQGMSAARGGYVLLLNPDTIVGEGALERTHDYLANTPWLAAAGCKILRPDGSIDPSCKRDFPSPWDAFCRMAGLSRLFPRSPVFARYDSRYLDEDRRQEMPLIDGCYMMIRRSALDDIGLFDERFFMYAEEMDWCRRAHARGWSIGYDPSGTIVHHKGEITRHSTFRMLYHFHRSMALYCRKYGNPWNPVLLAVYLGIALRLTALTALNLLRHDRRVSG